MIKRLAHRNANVQLYTLEVRLQYRDSDLQVLRTRNSWQMRYHRIAVPRCTPSWHREASQMQCYDWPTTGYVAVGSQIQ